MPGTVQPVSRLRTEKMRELTAATWWRLTIGLTPLAAGGAAIAIARGRNPAVVFLLVAVVVAIAGAIGTYVLANSRAKSAFMQAWATSRGWFEDPGSWLEEATPLLREGDRRHSDDHFGGPLVGGGQAALCHYTYEVESSSTDSKGNSTTSTTSYPFTVVQAPVEADGLPRLSLHRRSWGDNRLFDRIDSTLTSNRVVQLESSELEHEYKLEVADEASDVAVRLLFEPAFMVWCLDQAGEGMLLEIEDGTLVVAVPEHSYDAAKLDGLVDKAATVAARLADARAATPRET